MGIFHRDGVAPILIEAQYVFGQPFRFFTKDEKTARSERSQSIAALHFGGEKEELQFPLR